MLGLDTQPKTASYLKSLKVVSIAAMSDVRHYHAQLGHPDKGRVIKGLVVCYVVGLGSMIYEMVLWTSARCVSQVPCCGQDGYQAQVPQHTIDSCRYNTID